MLVLITAPMGVTFGQSTIQPDLRVGPEDISFAPPSPVHYGTAVSISADIHNLGICWVVLGDNGDFVGYDIDQPTSFNDITIAVRWRGTASFGASVRVSLGYDGTVDVTGDFNVTITTAWRTDTASGNYVISRPSGPYVVRVALLLGGNLGDIHVDWINVTMGTTTHFFEAEDYNPSTTTPAHSNGVDGISPYDALVRFYDGAPDSGGSQIGADQLVGDGNYVHNLSTWVQYIRNGGDAPASVTWTAAPPGYHDIYVVVDPDDGIPEADEANNKAFKTIGVYATLNIAANVGGTTNPLPGAYNYFNQSAKVWASAFTGYYLDHWTLDSVDHGATNPITVDMSEDHVLYAIFQKHAVGGVSVVVDKLSLLAPFIGLASTVVVSAVAGAVCLRRVRRRKEKR